MPRDINPWNGGEVSTTPQPEWLDELVPDGLEGAYIYGLETAAADESVLIIGPPGAGKTMSLDQRLGLLCEQEDIGPGDVTAITYRRSLADDLRRTLVEWGVYPEPDVTGGLDDEESEYEYWGTAHAVASRATGFLDSIGLDDANEMVDESDESEYAGMVGEKAIRKFCSERGISYQPSHEWYETRWTVFEDLYTFCRKNLIGIGVSELPDEMLMVAPDENAADPAEKAVAQHSRAWELYKEFRAEWGDVRLTDVVESWENWKQKNDVHDFFEMLEAGVTGPLPTTRVVVIDELHDAYPLMCLYFQRLIEAADTAIVAGDPLQICNAFSGATPELFNGLTDRVDTDLPIIQLPRSHRVSDEAFAAAERVLDQYHDPAELDTDGEGGVYSVETGEKIVYDDHTGWSLPGPDARGSPLRLWDELGTDVMMLARTQFLLDGIAAHLDREGVVYESQQPTVAGNWEARLGLLRVLNTFDGYRVRRQGSLTNDDFDGSEGSDDVKDVELATGTVLDVDDAILFARHVHQDYLRDDRDDVLNELREYRRSETKTVSVAAFNNVAAGDGFWRVYGRGGLSIDDLVMIDDYHGFTNRERAVTAMKAAWGRYYESGYSGDGRKGAVETLADGTKLYTIHASKGSESDSVCVFSGITNTVREAIDESRSDAENEARTWYVALTRAKHDLYVVKDWSGVVADEYLPDNLVRQARHDAQVMRQNSNSDGENVEE